ncbi:LL-diaminopimelate aminotransferase [Actinidia chinensis var. chinensis]|uniref:LL-diaminopimelate aminotransferase n=1 Tax=Actinidia chinensis var. chinensis TaxID=1590841 RepID=A0A2R6P511_ACTCC|nr:LL-diaminopimelate aminotransferase [Actinidia chinensis var. chinensis]
MVLLIGDLRREAIKKTSVPPSPSNAMLISKREHIFGRRVFGTRAQFCDHGNVHNLTIECDTISVYDPCLVIRVDSNMVMQVKHFLGSFGGMKLFGWMEFRWKSSGMYIIGCLARCLGMQFSRSKLVCHSRNHGRAKCFLIRVYDVGLARGVLGSLNYQVLISH